MDRKVIKLSDYKPYPTNPNTHDDYQIGELAKSLDEFGQPKNIVVWRDFIIAGHGLRQAAMASGLQELEAVDVSEWPREKAEKFMIADNRLPKLAEIDFETMALVIAGFDEPLNIPGVDEDWLSRFNLNGKETPGEDTEPQIDKAEELRQKWGVELGQLWQLGEHRLICGDCTDKSVVERVMGGTPSDIEIHDPPYGIDLDTDWSAAKSRLDFAAENLFFGGKRHKPIKGDNQEYDPSFLFNRKLPKEMFLWGADYYIDKIPNRNDGSWLIWDKRLDEAADKMYGSAFETLWSLSRHKRDFIRVKWAGIFGTEQEPDRKRLHPTQKPVLVYEWLLSQYSNKGDISGDFYLGAGSHLLAAHNLNRRCRGIEIDPGYVAVTLQRFLDHTGIEPILLSNHENRE